jgi:hypothetical protein
VNIWWFRVVLGEIVLSTNSGCSKAKTEIKVCSLLHRKEISNEHFEHIEVGCIAKANKFATRNATPQQIGETHLGTD